MNRAKSLVVRISAPSFFSVMIVLLLLSCNGNSPTEPRPQPPQEQPPQGTTGQVWGHVQNASGDCIIRAVVEVLDGPLAGAKSTQLDVCGPVWEGGAYSFDTLPVNTWVRLRASKEGYRSREMTFYAISGVSNPSNFVLERE